jgi:tetratricopeptide (TPR) repeat protein
LPPPAPQAFFGRDRLVEKIVDCAEELSPIALVGTGGIGKTSIALAVLHHHRIKERFGDNRRFIRCDWFPASHAHLLARLSEVIGAGVRNPEDLEPLRHHLSSKEMLVVLDNAESILDPQGTDAREIYATVEELSHFSNICLLITSRISTVPPRCKRPEIPTLSMDAACDIFYGIYSDNKRSGIIKDILQRLDFHALSVTLLATAASHNMWDHARLAEEWDVHRTQVLQTDCDRSLAATIELSLASPTFRKLGPDARDLLGVVAFFPQGIDEDNLDWFFPTIPNRKAIFNTFCVLSLVYRVNGFIMMLAPIRDHLCPQDPRSSPLLCATKDRYFTRLSVDLDPNQPQFKEAQWIQSEDMNVEHLLYVFTTIDTNELDVWESCIQFMRHLYWHKPRKTVLMSKINSLSDHHPSKPACLFELSLLLESVGNYPEEKQLLVHTLTLEREGMDDCRVARTLRFLSRVNLMLGLYKEGIQQAEEASNFYKLIGDTLGQAECFYTLSWLLLHENRLDAAEDAVLRMIEFLPEKGQDHLHCQSHQILGRIYRCKGEKWKAITHYEAALKIASHFDWQEAIFWSHYALAMLLSDEDKFDYANSHIQWAKLHTIDDEYNLGRAMGMQALIWYRQHRFDDAIFEALQALDVYEKLEAAQDVRLCRELVRLIEREVKSCPVPVTGGEFPGYSAAFYPY